MILKSWKKHFKRLNFKKTAKILGFTNLQPWEKEQVFKLSQISKKQNSKLNKIIIVNMAKKALYKNMYKI